MPLLPPHMALHVSQIIDWTPGNGTLALAAIVLKIEATVIVKNRTHEEAIRTRLETEVAERMDVPADDRFHQSDADLGVS